MSELAALEARDEFVGRHIGPSEAEVRAMLAALGCDSLATLLEQALPPAIRARRPLALPAARPEREVLAELRRLAAKNRVLKSFIGQGYYGTFTPPVILRNVLENPAWYTAYTPYQAEISQGRLEALLVFQTMVSDLTGLPIANASLLDEATAAAEAMAMARRASRSPSRTFFVSERCHPQTIAVLATRAECQGIELRVGDERAPPPDCFGALVQYPDTLGGVVDHRPLAEALHAHGALLVAATDLLALVLLSPPGEWGADIAVGSAQRFGVPMGYGGPHAAFLACREDLVRQLPGRLVGVSRDAQGAPALRLALQTREQHIRREKATSNICTAQVLLAVIAAMYAVWHGPQGLERIARRTHRMAALAAQGLARLGFAVSPAAFFDTIVAETGAATEAIHAAAIAYGMNFRRLEGGRIGLSFDETTTREDVARLLSVFARGAGRPPVVPEADAAERLPEGLRRASPFLTHPVFHAHRSETAMLRYLRRLADRDLALDRTMIPLGSCTMKLNPTAAMIPITWEGFAGMHPYAPADQAAGYGELIADLCAQLAEITGMDAVSVQPNAGAQGEFAGLLAIRAWHRARGEPERDLCLIPSSAHGTNPASARMAGMSVVEVACDAHGNVDVADLRAKAAAHRERLAALMITYPSTHGVFEESIREICDLVHAAGGQVYMDGANLNALVGLARPGELGADVCHVNLHKTFAIPHGGGGPGAGPIAVKAHLAPYLPGDPLEAAGAVGPVSAAKYGSAGILPISWAYIALMGADGLRRASEAAILAANYVAARLAPHYPVLYTGRGGRVAHECILDLRPLRETAGITAEDVAKRLADYGFHAPTMSFPVAGTLMVEPTESESLAELDRFIDAMIAIRAEIREIEEGRADREDNVLKNAPHTAAMCAADEWRHRYRRAQAAFPLPSLRAAKYWPPVGRVDNAWGDRHLVCVLPPPEASAAAGR
ncbi:MAG: aminomethyl-transferring glycine dehydrogenase [Burkholderiales bacterium]|nr:aminomethyl-transferring glycine dehydrogenase [Burkholderiales bacterium]